MAIDISRTFCWNVLDYIQISKTFEWHVGEGPLHWFRIEWKDPICPPLSCVSNISVCSITGTECKCIDAGCTVPAGTDPCICTQCEVWHVLATSVEHLCERLNNEKCLVKPQGKVFKRVQKWGIPALCCDVEKFMEKGKPLISAYLDVDFCKCPCVSYVDPCDCGDIKTPCDPCAIPSVEPYPTSPLPMAQQLFGIMRPRVGVAPGFMAEQIEITKPQADRIITKCNQLALSSNLKLRHNLAKTNMLKQFLARHKAQLPEEVDLVYNKSSDTWQKTIHLKGQGESWTVFFEWSCTDEAAPGRYGWRYHMHVTKQAGGKRQNTRVVILLNTSGTSEQDNLFTASFNLNTKTDTVAIRQSVSVQAKNVHDDIGLFQGDWLKDPYLKVSLSAKKG